MSNKIILYFSGSGNSRLVAKNMSEILKAELFPVTKAPKISHNIEILGIVFPVYHASFGESGLPFAVKKMISNLPKLNNTYIFGICTHLGKPHNTISNLNDELRKRSCSLSAGFELKLGLPYTVKQKILSHFLNIPLKVDLHKEITQRKEILKKINLSINEITEHIQNKENLPINRRNDQHKQFRFQRQLAIKRYQYLSGSQSDNFEYLINHSDRSFTLNGNCIGCGSCMRVCPVNNIIIQNDQPLWEHHCENCFACFHWCPQNAIEGEIVKYEKRIHYPEITLTNMTIN